jgi:hypothetical protein
MNEKPYLYRVVMYCVKDNAYLPVDHFYTKKCALTVAEAYAEDRKTHVQVIGKEGIVDEFPKTKTRKKVAC